MPKKPKSKGAKKAKVDKVFKEFGAGKLKSGSKQGPTVTKHKQAVAIALSEAGMSKKKKQMKGKIKNARSYSQG